MRIQTLEAQLKEVMLKNNGLKADNTRLEELLAKHGIDASGLSAKPEPKIEESKSIGSIDVGGSDRIAELDSSITIRFNKLEHLLTGSQPRGDSQNRVRFGSTGREDRQGKVQELEATIGKLMQRNKRLKSELRGYRNFSMPINLSTDDLEDRVVDGDAKAYAEFARHAVVGAFREKADLGSALNYVYRSLREAVPGSHWAMIFYPSGRAFQSSVNRTSSLTLSFFRGPVEYQLFIARLD